MAKPSAKNLSLTHRRATGRFVSLSLAKTSAEGPGSRDLLLDYQSGDRDAADVIFRRYVERLVALARSRMSARLRQRIDPDDIVQSAYRSFFVHARNEEYALSRAGDLWRLLASITLHKLYGQAERHTAGRRSMAKEIQDEEQLARLASLEPTPAQAAALAEQLHPATAALSDAERSSLIARLQGESVEAIAAQVGKAPRTVRRLLAQARAKLENQLLARSDSGTPPVAIDRAATPLRYEDYVLEKLLGTGGMGKVYRARHRTSGEVVALKALHKTWQHDHRAVERLVQEARLLAHLRHPHVVGVRGLGRFPGGSCFLVMDLIAGGDVAACLKQGPMSVTEAARIVGEVASAVGFAHQAGVLHCDLKPANVLVDASGKAFVTDFGFANFIMMGSHAGRDAVGGTAGYMAPEVASGTTGPTVAADIYGLGCLLWVLATAQSPTLPLDLSAAQQSRELACIATIVRQCTHVDSCNRFASAEDLQLKLRELAGNAGS